MSVNNIWGGIGRRAGACLFYYKSRKERGKQTTKLKTKAITEPSSLGCSKSRKSNQEVINTLFVH